MWMPFSVYTLFWMPFSVSPFSRTLLKMAIQKIDPADLGDEAALPPLPMKCKLVEAEHKENSGQQGAPSEVCTEQSTVEEFILQNKLDDRASAGLRGLKTKQQAAIIRMNMAGAVTLSLLPATHCQPCRPVS